MKAAIYYGPRDVRVEDVPTPELKNGDILLKIRACGICGSDLHTYGHGLFEDLGIPVGSGRVLGHEFSGEIAEINGQVEKIKVGDRICGAGAGGNAEYSRVQASRMRGLLPIPENIGFEEAATVEPLATSLHAVNLAGPKDGETCVIMGAGIIGLGILQVLKARAAVKTIVADLSTKRLDMAKQLGADVIINASHEDAFQKVMEITGAEQLPFMPGPTAKADTVFDCAGLPKGFTGIPVLQQAISMAKREGKVVVVSVFEKPIAIETNYIVLKGITLIGSWAWSPDELRESLELMTTEKVDRKPLITHQFPLDKASEAYETQLRAAEAVKVLLKPQELNRSQNS
jgi:2-desacetyl-2-hydroxyethyl bacteriochlorophyllide A dehydrogenase